MQSDMSLSNDTFTATVSNQDAILRDLKFQIKVIPLVRRQEKFRVTENKMQLTQKHLDASHLAGLTNSNPMYFLQGIIVRYPQNIVSIRYFIQRIFTSYVTYYVKACDYIEIIEGIILILSQALM